MTGRFRSFSNSRPAKPASRPALTRPAWRELLEPFAQAIDFFGRDEPTLSAAEEMALRDGLRSAAAADLPVEGASAKWARTAFVEAGQGFLASNGERRLIFARLLRAAISAVSELLDREQQAAAAGWQRQFGDDA